MADNQLAEGDHGDEGAYTVRPYAVTGGRIETEGLEVETLVSTLDAGRSATGLTPEKKKILELAGENYISIAELSAHCKLPLGVIRVLVRDLSDAEYLEIQANSTAQPDGEKESGGLTLSLLESVLDGIAAL